MPIIEVGGPAIKDLDKKRAFVQQMTTAASELYGLPPESIIMVFREAAPENVSVGGTLIVDRHKG